MKKHKSLFIFVVALLFASCASTRFVQIGQINMISTRNVESQTQYALISTYAGGSDKEMKDSRALTIDDAINQTVKAVPGGEYMKNVRLYMVIRKGKYYYAAQGDVWGAATEISYRGFKSGDKVTWKARKAIIDGGAKIIVTGVITSLKNDKTCFVKRDDTQETVELSYDNISKVQ